MATGQAPIRPTAANVTIAPKEWKGNNNNNNNNIDNL